MMAEPAQLEMKAYVPNTTEKCYPKHSIRNALTINTHSQTLWAKT